MSWRHVPEPAQIARLERDVRGYPIPYIAQRWDIQVPPPVDPILGMIAVSDPNKPNVDLGHMDEARQRECWLDGRCQVCRRSIRPGSRWLAGGVGDRPLEAFGFREPYVCGSCMRYALQVCPGLIHGRRNGDLRVVRPVTVQLSVERMLVNLLTGESKQEVYPIGVNPPASVAFYMRGKVTEGEVMRPDEYLEK